MGSHGPRARFEAISLVWLKFCDLIHAFDPMAHKMTRGAKKNSYPHLSFGDLGRCQRPVLPLKIVLRRGNKTKDLLKRPIDMGMYVDTDHCIFLCGCHHIHKNTCSE